MSFKDYRPREIYEAENEVLSLKLINNNNDSILAHLPVKFVELEASPFEGDCATITLESGSVEIKLNPNIIDELKKYIQRNIDE